MGNYPYHGTVSGVHPDDTGFWTCFPGNIPPVKYHHGNYASFRLRNDLVWWSKPLPDGSWVNLSYWVEPNVQFH